jgi:enoyl-CoA hydratase
MAIDLIVEGSLATVTLDRQHKLNALDLQSYAQLDEHLQSITESAAVRAVIVRASGGRAFSAGADINDLRGIDPDEARKRATYRRNIFQKLSDLPIPSVAAVDGMAFGGGMELALACTFRIASPSSTFCFPEIKLGLLPAAGGTQRLPKLVGRTMALELMLTARKLSATEAHSIGLIDRIVDNPVQAASSLAQNWIGYSKPAITAILEAVRSSELCISDGLSAEGEQLSALVAGRDAAEGIAAFFEKRSPQFNSK